MKVRVQKRLVLMYVFIFLSFNLCYINDVKGETTQQQAEVVSEEDSFSEVIYEEDELCLSAVLDSGASNSNYGIVKTFGNVNQNYIEIVEDTLLLMPQDLVEAFVNDEWCIFVTTENLSQKYFNGKYFMVIGVTLPKNKYIKVANKYESLAYTTLHEFGHYLDQACSGQFSSKSEEFKQIYLEEKDTFKANNTQISDIRDEKEFFAEMFRCSIQDIDKCTPKALHYVNSQLAKLKWSFTQRP